MTLGAVIDSQEYREYVINKTDQIVNELNKHCEPSKCE